MLLNDGKNIGIDCFRINGHGTIIDELETLGWLDEGDSWVLIQSQCVGDFFVVRLSRVVNTLV